MIPYIHQDTINTTLDLFGLRSLGEVILLYLTACSKRSTVKFPQFVISSSSSYL